MNRIKSEPLIKKEKRSCLLYGESLDASEIITISSDEETDDSNESIITVSSESDFGSSHRSLILDKTKIIAADDDYDDLPDLPDLSVVGQAMPKTSHHSLILDKTKIIAADDDYDDLPVLPDLSVVGQAMPKISHHSLILDKTKIRAADDDYDDLPDLPDLSVVGQAMPKTSHHSPIFDKTKIRAADDDYDDLPDLPDLSAVSQPMPKHKQFEIDLEPPQKIFKPSDKEYKDELILAVKNKISLSLLRGGLKGCVACCYDLDQCFTKHITEAKPATVSIYCQTLFETMMEDECYQQFALRAMCQHIDRHHFLGPVVCSKLLGYLFGDEEKMEVCPITDLYLGIAVLHKQLSLHPPCRPSMRQFYLKMCQNYWPTLLVKLEDLLSSQLPVSEESHPPNEDVVADGNPVSEEFELFNFSDVIKKKEMEKRKRYQNQPKDEKLRRVYVILKFFTELFKTNTQLWHRRHYCEKLPVFRQDINPLLSAITWTSALSVGTLNQHVKRIFFLYCQIMEPNVHSLLGVIIGLYASIIHRFEKSIFPEMGSYTRSFALGLYQVIKSHPHIEKNVRQLNPDWLKFHVTSYFLNVEEPANYYKCKERIAQILYAKDKGYSSENSVNMEIICYEAIKAMMGMMELKSYPSEVSMVIEEDILENSWFREGMEYLNIRENLETIKRLLLLPCVKGRAGFYFDGFEDDVEKMFPVF